MTWRTALGLKPTPTDLALDLLKAAERHGLTGWQHDSENDAIRNGDRVINLANMHLEYAAASRLHRRGLLQKYFAMLQTAPVSKLWSLAQTKIYPLLRSRYDLLTHEIASRRKEDPFPPRAARRFIGNLNQILGYDHGQTVSQVQAATLADWAVSLDAVRKPAGQRNAHRHDSQSRSTPCNWQRRTRWIDRTARRGTQIPARSTLAALRRSLSDRLERHPALCPFRDRRQGAELHPTTRHRIRLLSTKDRARGTLRSHRRRRLRRHLRVARPKE